MTGDWQARDDAKAREFIENANRLGRESYERTLRECREFGIAKVEYIVADDACAACRALVGRAFDLLAAPPLPIAGCCSEFCRCSVVGNFD